MGREQLRQAHAGDRLKGLSERQVADLHVYFAACERAALSSYLPRLPASINLPLSSVQQRAPPHEQAYSSVAAAGTAVVPQKHRLRSAPSRLGCRHAAAGAQHGHGRGAAAAPAGGGHGGRVLSKVLPAAGLLRRRPPPARPRLPLPGLQNRWELLRWEFTGPAGPWFQVESSHRASRALLQEGGQTPQPCPHQLPVRQCLAATYRASSPPLPACAHHGVVLPRRASLPGAEETPIHSKLLLHYARRLCTKHGALPPPDLAQLVTAEATLLVGCRWLMGRGARGAPLLPRVVVSAARGRHSRLLLHI